MKYNEKLLDTLDKMEMNMEKLTEDELKRISALQKEKMNLQERKSKKTKWKSKQLAGIAAACLIIVGSTFIFIQSHDLYIGETKDRNIITQDDSKSQDKKDGVGIASIEPDTPNQTEVTTSDGNDKGVEIAIIDDSNNQNDITSVEPDKNEPIKEITTDDNEDSIGIASVDDSDSQQNTARIICNNFDQAKEILGYTVMIPSSTLDELNREDIKVIDKKILEINYVYKNALIVYRTTKSGNYVQGSVVDDNAKTIKHNEMLITIKENQGKRMFEFKKEDRSFSMDISGVISNDDIIKIIDSIRPY